jgi:hypothetical protein
MNAHGLAQKGECRLQRLPSVRHSTLGLLALCTVCEALRALKLRAPEGAAFLAAKLEVLDSFNLK